MVRRESGVVATVAREEMRVAIVGSGGRLGAALARAYGGEHEVIGFTHADLDLAAADSIRENIQPLDFDTLINCAALTNVDYCETHEAEAMRINAEAVCELAEICAGKNARFIQISTDYVFDGEKATPYSEDDPAKAISIYGESKRLGEEEALAVSKRNLVARVAWVFGPDRPSFIDLILKRAQESEEVAAISDKMSAPTFTIDAAEWLRPFVTGEISDGGLLHLCNGGECSWRDYGQHAIDCALAAGWPIKGKSVGALALTDMKNFVARRPVYTVLSTEKLAGLTGQAPRNWQEAVDDYVRNYCKAQ